MKPEKNPFPNFPFTQKVKLYNFLFPLCSESRAFPCIIVTTLFILLIFTSSTHRVQSLLVLKTSLTPTEPNIFH